LGKAFPLTINTWGAVLIRTDFFGISNANFWLDTADYFDGAFSAGPFNRQLAKQKPNFTNHWKAPNGIVFARFPEVEFAGQTYTNLLLHRCPRMLSLVHPKIIGLRFLARHRVTFNFPKRMMYLQQRSVGPLPDGMAALMESLGCLDGKPPKDLEARIKTLAKQRPVLRRYLDGDEFLSSLKKKGQLPGWLKDETRYTQFRPDADLAFEWEQTTEPDDYPVAQTLALSKKSDSSIYQYTVIKASKDAPWQLQRAWKAAPTGRIRKDYPVP